MSTTRPSATQSATFCLGGGARFGSRKNWIMNSVTNQKGQAQAKRVQNCAKSAHIKLMAIKSQPSRAMIGWICAKSLDHSYILVCLVWRAAMRFKHCDHLRIQFGICGHNFTPFQKIGLAGVITGQTARLRD